MAFCTECSASIERRGPQCYPTGWKKPCIDRGVRRLLEYYATRHRLGWPALSPHRRRYLLVTWLKRRGVDDALIQPYSGHACRESLEIAPQLAIGEAQLAYDGVVARFPV
jgi:integrase/recombinase XerD